MYTYIPYDFIYIFHQKTLCLSSWLQQAFWGPGKISWTQDEVDAWHWLRPWKQLWLNMGLTWTFRSVLPTASLKGDTGIFDEQIRVQQLFLIHLLKNGSNNIHNIQMNLRIDWPPSQHCRSKKKKYTRFHHIPSPNFPHQIVFRMRWQRNGISIFPDPWWTFLKIPSTRVGHCLDCLRVAWWKPQQLQRSLWTMYGCWQLWCTTRQRSAGHSGKYICIWGNCENLC